MYSAELRKHVVTYFFEFISKMDSILETIKVQYESRWTRWVPLI
jgi:hypothetical protein